MPTMLSGSPAPNQQKSGMASDLADKTHFETLTLKHFMKQYETMSMFDGHLECPTFRCSKRARRSTRARRPATCENSSGFLKDVWSVPFMFRQHLSCLLRRIRTWALPGACVSMFQAGKREFSSHVLSSACSEFESKAVWPSSKSEGRD